MFLSQCRSACEGRSRNTGEGTHGPLTLGLAPRSSRYISLIRTPDLTYTGFFGRTFESLPSSTRLQFKLRFWKKAKMNHKLQASMTYCPIPEWNCGYWNVLLNNMIYFKSLRLEQETKAKNQNHKIRKQSGQRARTEIGLSGRHGTRFPEQVQIWNGSS